MTSPEAVAHQLIRTPEGHRNPYPLYHQLRELAPVHRSEAAKGWLVTRYDDCRTVMRDPRFQKLYDEAMDARSRHWRERPALRWAGETLLNLDAPLHTRLRRHVFTWFTRGSVEQLRPTVEAMVDQLLGEFGEGDLMQQVAFRLPIGVIGELLGVPAEDLPAFRDLTLRLTAAFELGATREQLDEADAAADEMTSYFDALIGGKRARPGDDLISRLIGAADEGDGLTDREISALATLLFFAGFETTTNMIGHGVLAFLDFPDQVELLRAQPELWKSFTAEILRHSGTVQLISRFAVEDVEVGGVTIPAGESVYPLIGAGNRDPARYVDPDRFDLTRTDIHPLSFGGGVHHCLGASLADMELEILFRRLIEEYDVTELGELHHYRDRLSLQAPAEVPIRLSVRGTAAPLASRPTGDDSAWRASYRRRAEETAPPDPQVVALRRTLLERLPFFAGCAPDELEVLAATSYDLAFEAGDRLIVQGAESLDCYVIVEGEAEVTIDGVPVRTVGADDIVGEIGLVEHRTRTATVTASGHLIVFAISAERLGQVTAANPAAADHMQKVLYDRYGV
ncbi:MAG TPA: cytochrome P450 [Nocardioidaceae bacterium]|nr:cytochrome P450 [Nocardioidaceae bacterium]